MTEVSGAGRSGLSELNRTPSADSFPDLRGDIPARVVRGGVESLPDPLSDAQLVVVTQSTGGFVMVGLKPANARRSKVNGIFPAMTREEALSARSELAAVPGVRLIQSFHRSSSVVAQIDPESAPSLRALSFVNWLEPLVPFQATGAGPGLTVPMLASSVDSIPWGVVKVGALDVWNTYDQFGSGVAVSVLDYGTDQTHYASGEFPATLDCLSPVFFSEAPEDTCFDQYYHGTHVAGIAVARLNNAGIAGVAPEVSHFASYKVCKTETQFLAAGCYPPAIVWALETIAEDGPFDQHIVNMSFGRADTDSDIVAALDNLAALGMLLVASAGNIPNSENYVGVVFPARHADVIAVSGTLENDAFASSYVCPSFLGTRTTSSQSGNEVELAAPFWAYSTRLDGNYGVDCGTSMAAPHVTGVAALLWAQNAAWTSSQVRGRLQESAVDLGANGQDPYFGYGRVSAMRALAPPLSVGISGPTQIRPGATCSWSADVTGGSGGYSYTWTQNVTEVGTGPEYAGAKDAGITNSYFTLKVRVVAGNGSVGEDQITVTENAQAMLCAGGGA